MTNHKRIIAVYNNAGGVAKSTTVRDLGFELAQRGSRVLLIDADFQGSLGSFLKQEPQGRDSKTLFWYPLCHDLETPPPIEQIYDNLWIGLANFQLASDEQILALAKNPNVLYHALQTLDQSFDFVLIDCPPTINEISVQVLQAAKEILIPVQTEDKAYAGLGLIQREILRANKRKGGLPPLKICGLLPTRYNKQFTFHRHYLEQIQKSAMDLGCTAFSPIRAAQAVQEACNPGLPLHLYEAKSPALNDVRQLADDILSQP